MHELLAHLAGEGDAEGLCAEYSLSGQGQEGGVDCNGQLHGQLWWNHAGDDHRAVQQQLEAVPVRVLYSTNSQTPSGSLSNGQAFNPTDTEYDWRKAQPSDRKQ